MFYFIFSGTPEHPELLSQLDTAYECKDTLLNYAKMGYNMDKMVIIEYDGFLAKKFSFNEFITTL